MKNNKIKIIFISIIFLVNIIILLNINFNNKNMNDNLFLAFYNGNKKLDEMPSKDNVDNLVFVYSICDNNAYIEWDSENWSPLVKNLSKSNTKCSLYFGKPVEFEEEVPIVENGDGLYKVNHNALKELDRVWDKTEYRYAGVNVNNYVRFNNEIWRIIGLVNVKTSEGIEQRLKIIRQAVIEGQKSLGEYSWDYKLPGNGSSIHNYGSNDWTDSQLKDMLNGIYYESKSGDCYRGKSVASQCDFTNFQGLNDIARKMIDKDIIWNIGGYINSNIVADDFYEKERSTTVYSNGSVTRPAEWSSVTDVGEKHNGVGLMYPSDYGYAVGGSVRNNCLTKNLFDYNSDDCYQNDWLYIITNQWLLTPSSSYSQVALKIRSDGSVNAFTNCDSSNSVSPVVYLKKNVKMISNPYPDKTYGSIDNPILLAP